MKRFILERIMQYTERAEVEADTWEEAKEMLRDSEADFNRIEDDVLFDESIEYIGDIRA